MHATWHNYGLQHLLRHERGGGAEEHAPICLWLAHLNTISLDYFMVFDPYMGVKLKPNGMLNRFYYYGPQYISRFHANSDNKT